MQAWILQRFPGSSVQTPEHRSWWSTRWLIGCSRSFLALLIMIAACGSSVAQSRVSSTPVAEEGLWLSQDHDGVFLIGRCGDTLCGSLIGMQYDGPVPKDVWGRSQCGLVMLTDFRQTSDGNGWQGHILDPESGRTYDARIRTESRDVLKLRGYILGITLFGQTQKWTRYHGKIGPDCKLP